MKKAILVALMLALVVFTSQAQEEAATPQELCEAAVPAEEPENRTYEAPEQVLEEGVDYRAIFCTDAGAVYIDLYEFATPNTVNNFVFLAQNGYYNNTVFHRVLEGFMAQGGDPTGTGMGGPGYEFEDEYPWFIQFDRPGLLAMANAGPGTNGSQFFITTVPTPHLNFQFDPQRGLVGHTIFGGVLEGQENVEGFTLRDPNTATEDSPSTQLQTVLIVTDPESVETTYTAPEPANTELIVEKFEELAATVTETPELSIETPDHILTLEEVVAIAPEDVQEDFSAALEENNFETGASIEVVNTACNLEFNFLDTSYKLYGFASRADASAALADGVFQTLAEAEGFEQTEDMVMGVPLYTLATEACEGEAQTGRIYVPRGRYIAALEITIPADATFDAGVGLQRLTANVFEATLAEVLALELTK